MYPGDSLVAKVGHLLYWGWCRIVFASHAIVLQSKGVVHENSSRCRNNAKGANPISTFPRWNVIRASLHLFSSFQFFTRFETVVGSLFSSLRVSGSKFYNHIWFLGGMISSVVDPGAFRNANVRIISEYVCIQKVAWAFKLHPRAVLHICSLCHS